MIEVKNINYTYPSSDEDNTQVLYDVSMSINKGEFIALVGCSGCGKSTFIRHLNALLKADSGDILFNGESIYKKGYPLGKLRQKVGLVFQYPENQLFSRTVIDDVAFGPINLGFSREESFEKAKHALSTVNIDESLFSSSPYELSGGQMRRVAIAGVIAMDPEVLILDEPTAGLDPYTRNNLMKMLKNMQKKGTTIILVSHSMEEVADFADRVVVFKDGRILIDNTTDYVFSQRDIIKSAGLNPPRITDIMFGLIEKGIPLNTVSHNKDEASDIIMSALYGGETHA